MLSISVTEGFTYFITVKSPAVSTVYRYICATKALRGWLPSTVCQLLTWELYSYVIPIYAFYGCCCTCQILCKSVKISYMQAEISSLVWVFGGFIFTGKKPVSEKQLCGEDWEDLASLQLCHHRQWHHEEYRSSGFDSACEPSWRSDQTAV